MDLKVFPDSTDGEVEGGGMPAGPAGSKLVIAALAVSAVALFGALLYLSVGREHVSATHAEVEPPPAATAAGSAKSADDKLKEQLASASTYEAAYELVKPHLLDTVGEVSKGATLLASWLGRRGRWEDIYHDGLGPSTKLIKKDPEAARGQLTCLRGYVARIERTSDTLFEGQMISGNDVVHYYAAGKTGSLAQGDRARFCGVVTGMFTFANASGGQTECVQLVGMFDLRDKR